MFLGLLNAGLMSIQVAGLIKVGTRTNWYQFNTCQLIWWINELKMMVTEHLEWHQAIYLDKPTYLFNILAINHFLAKLTVWWLPVHFTSELESCCLTETNKEDALMSEENGRHVNIAYGREHNRIDLNYQPVSGGDAPRGCFLLLLNSKSRRRIRHK